MIWIMDTECCANCGCILAYGEVGMCSDCWQDELFEADQYDDWWYDDDEENNTSTA